MDVIYKKATEKDIPTIVHLADVIWRKHYPSIITAGQIDYMLDKMYSPNELLKQMNEGQQFILAYINEAPVGYIALSTRDGKNYFIHKFYVLVDEHRKGIGSQLFQHILKQIPDAETIELAVNRENYKAINFYFKLGFIIKHSFDLEIGEGYFMNDFMMIKKIVS